MVTNTFRLVKLVKYMSPVSPVFHTEETVSTQNKLRMEHPFHNIRCPCWLAERSKLSSQYIVDCRAFPW